MHTDLIHSSFIGIQLDANTTLQWVSESSCLIQVNEISLDEANERISLWANSLASDKPHWLNDYVPSYTSLLVTYDCLKVDVYALERYFKNSYQQIASTAECLHDTASEQKQSESLGASKQFTAERMPNKTVHKTHIVPVCYEPISKDAHLPYKNNCDYENDIQAISQRLTLSAQEIIHLHSASVYRIYAVGFLPNFAYMGQIPQQLELMRRASPRKRVGPGAVAIADRQTAIYPQVSPGGWHILGYCPLNLAGGASLRFRTGDWVQFRVIGVREFYDIANEVVQETQGDAKSSITGG
ncbi:5-oxoprolinase subunit B family protein [Ningiella sp. W23]|uniref:5-oxoprolinase subunit B family protein n=1 Tax=Ningiella sp. W23 TaxID=3023715 RepID=UPI0037575D77